MTENQKKAALTSILQAIVESVRDAGPQGAPAGPLYAALMAHGCTLDQFEQIMSALVKAEKLTKRGQLYFTTGGN